jgi:NCS2 family nucleobase:cation symporter-2
MHLKISDTQLVFAKGVIIVSKKDTYVTYEVNDKPPLGTGFLLGFQHISVMFGGNVAVSLILAGAIGLTLTDTAFLIQCAMFAAGVTTIVQALGVGPVGSKLPIVMGSSFIFLGTSIAIGANPALGLSALFGAILVGGLLEAIFGYWILKALRKAFSPIVTGTVVLAIGLSLFGVAIDYAAGGAFSPDYGSGLNLGLAAFTLIVVIILNQFGSPRIKAASVIMGLVVGFIAAIPLGLVDFSGVAGAGWFAFPKPFNWGISFKLEAIIPMAFLYLVSMVEFVGDITGVAINAVDRTPTEREFTGGILADGLGSAFSGMFNCTPNVSYSQNVGLIPLTGIKSRYVVVYGGIVMTALAFIPKVSQIVVAIPPPVLGGVLISMFGLIVVSGIKVIITQKLTQRNMLVIGIALAVGMGLNGKMEAIAILPSMVQNLLSGVGGTGLIALFLNIVLPKQAEDKEAEAMVVDETYRTEN